jgi:hypothetical protein
MLVTWRQSAPPEHALIAAVGDQIRSATVRSLRYDNRVEFSMSNGEIWTYASSNPGYADVAALAERDLSSLSLLASPRLGRDLLNGIQTRHVYQVTVGGKQLVTYASIASSTRRNAIGLEWLAGVFFAVGISVLWANHSGKAGAA